jgi:hypothetical protein
MARYEAGARSSLVTATANAPLVSIRVPATEVGKLRELGVTLVAATSTLLGLARATVVSATPATTMPGRNVIVDAPDSATLLVNSWTTVPTVSANLLRRITLPAVIGAGFIWTWERDDPLQMGDGQAIREICLVNLVAVAPSVFDWYAIWED